RMDAITVGLNGNPRFGICQVDFAEPLVPMDHVVMEDRLRQASPSDQSKQFVFQLAVSPFASPISRRKQSTQKPRASPAAKAAEFCLEPRNISHALAYRFVQQFLQKSGRKRCRKIYEGTGHARRRNPFHQHHVRSSEARPVCGDTWALQLLGRLDMNPSARKDIEPV